MFKKLTVEISRISHEIVNLRLALSEFARTVQGAGGTEAYEGLRARLDSLEGPLNAKLGEVEGLLAKAEGFKHAARAAEERSRGNLKRAEEAEARTEDVDFDDSVGISDEDVAYAEQQHAPRVPTNPVLPLSVNLGNRRR